MIPLPEAFIDEVRPLLGGETGAFVDALGEASTLALRLNPLRAGAWALARSFVCERVPWESLGYYLREGVRPGAGISHAAGAFYLQEASAMLAVAALEPRPGERILDLCAAPGGKSTQIAAAMRGEGLLISNEPEPARAKVLASNLERMGVSNAAVVCAYPDALSARWAGCFDAVLCDAPCSGEGMFRRNPEARAQWSAGAPAGCFKRQAEILDHAARLLRPGGRLVYSTCTFNAVENEGSIDAFLSRHPEFSPEDFTLPTLGTSVQGMMRIWPQRVRGDGHFAARLRKAEDCAPIKLSVHRGKERSDEELRDALQRLRAELCAPCALLDGHIVHRGDRAILLPRDCPDMSGLKVICPGLYLMRIGRSHIEPEHALAMAIDPALPLRRAELDDEQARRYLMGESPECEGAAGYTLALWRTLPLGWGKMVDHRLKNRLPMRTRTLLPAH